MAQPTPAPTTPQRATDRRVCTSQPPAGATPVRVPATPQHPQRARAIEAHVRSLFASRPTASQAVSAPSAGHHPMSVNAALDVFDARVQADMRDLRVLCAALLRAEQQEKEQWRELCKRVIGERDAARAALGGAAPGGTLKRVHGSDGSVSAPAASSSSSTGEQPRAVRPLPTASRSHSRSSSTRSGSSSEAQRASFGSSARSTPPPLQDQLNIPCTPARNRSAPPSSAPFQCRQSPSTTTASRASISTSAPIAPDADAPAPKRRRSCDLSLSAQLHGGVPPRQPTRTGAPALPGDFAHVDIMYATGEGATMVCRACSLEAAKASPGETRAEPHTFPKGASWDELRAHCVQAHPEACIEVARLHPAEIFELRRRLSI